ncbi:hypothetical protein BJY01DRAFT_167733 [Aspergillus pseudoustus]|uniref:Transcription activator of gluconeogenesis acuK n=1 Tax=Aspergillus pseudoustus TaxID=1810923 RepID=A0ABR4K531_9EURO
MNDPFLSAWTTQYTNVPVPPEPTRTMTSTFEKTRPRRKARRSCMNCQRGHRTCDDQRPCEQCTKRGKQATCIDGNHKQFKYLRDSEYHPTRRMRRSREGSEGTTAPEYIDPAMLQAQSDSNSATAGMGLLRNGDNADIPPPPRSTSSYDDSGVDTPPLQEDEGFGEMVVQGQGEDIFEDILDELLEFDATKPHAISFNDCEDYHKPHSHGFSISTGWSSTFFPPGQGQEEHERSWNMGVDCGMRRR